MIAVPTYLLLQIHRLILGPGPPPSPEAVPTAGWEQGDRAMPMIRRRFTPGGLTATIAIFAGSFAPTRGLPWQFPLTLSARLLVPIFVPRLMLVVYLTISISCVPLG